MAVLVTETFSGNATLAPTGGDHPITGFDSPLIWNQGESRWADVLATVDNVFPCPHGGSRAFRIYGDCGHLDLLGLSQYNLRNFFVRMYLRFGNASAWHSSYSGGWSKVLRLRDDSWDAFNLCFDETNDLSNSYMGQLHDTPDAVWTGAIWTPCKWMYTEWHIVLNTTGGSDNGTMQIKTRNVTDNGPPYTSPLYTGLNFSNGTNPLGWLCFPGNNDRVAPDIPDPTQGVIRYANFAIGDSEGWIGEAGGTTPPPIYDGVMTLGVH